MDASTSHLRAIVLGSAAGGGFPQWNCGCPNCLDVWAGRNGLTPRTQSSLAATGDGGAHWALLNASPDLRAQILATPALQPRREGRDSPIASVLLTNGDLDHIAGLLTLREKQPFALFATAEILSILNANPVFNALDRDLVRFLEIAVGAPFELAPGLIATLFQTPGKEPLFMEGGAPPPDAPQGRLSDLTVGVALEAAGARLTYIPGCARMTEDLSARLRGAEAVLFDGTVFHDDEMVRAGVGAKTGRRMGHMPMAGAAGSLAAFESLGVRRKVYIHINNTNPVLRPGSLERAEAEAQGWEIAHDGLEIQLPVEERT